MNNVRGSAFAGWRPDIYWADMSRAILEQEGSKRLGAGRTARAGHRAAGRGAGAVAGALVAGCVFAANASASVGKGAQPVQLSARLSPAGTAVAAVLVLILLVVLINPLRAWRRHKASQREREIEPAAREAAKQDAAFEPEAVQDQAARLFTMVYGLRQNDRDRLKRLMSPEAYDEWDRRTTDLESKHRSDDVIEVRDEPTVRYVGLRNLAADSDDRVVVRIDATLFYSRVNWRGKTVLDGDQHGAYRTRVSEYWTLAKNLDRSQTDPVWMVVLIERDREGGHELQEKIIATPQDDTTP